MAGPRAPEVVYQDFWELPSCAHTCKAHLMGTDASRETLVPICRPRAFFFTFALEVNIFCAHALASMLFGVHAQDLPGINY